MGATTPVGFDPDPKMLGVSYPGLTAGSTILAGQIVGFAASGASWKVIPVTSSTEGPIGVALNGAATGEPVAVAGPGSIVKIELSADDGTADAGDWIGVSTVAGCGIVRDPAIQAHDTIVGLQNVIGRALEDISAGASNVGGKGYIIVVLSPPVCASS